MLYRKVKIEMKELPVLCKRMAEHKEKSRQGVSSQLTAFRPEWSDFRGIRSDLYIRELEESIPALQREADSIGGMFGFVKRNKIKKEIETQQIAAALHADVVEYVSNKKNTAHHIDILCPPAYTCITLFGRWLG